MSEYLNPVQRHTIERLLSSPTARTEWPTWVALVAVYGAWVAAICGSVVLGPYLTTPLLILICAWYMSIQHELVHGHPTRIRWLNKALGFAPLAIWFPYTLYAESHLRHHNDKNLTLPDIDPETHYVSGARWDTSGKVMRLLYTARKSFWGRFFFLPVGVFPGNLVNKYFLLLCFSFFCKHFKIGKVDLVHICRELYTLYFNQHHFFIHDLHYLTFFSGK